MQKLLAIALVLLFLLLMFVPSGKSVNATSQVVQSYEGNGTYPSFQLTFSGVVHAGDLLIAVEGTTYGGLTYSAPYDTQNNNWISVNTYCGTYACVVIWYANASKTSSPDTVTLSSPSSSFATYGFIMDVSGGSFLGYYSTGSGSSGNPSVSSFVPTPGSFVVAVAAGPTSWSAGSGYSLVGSNTGWSSAAEFAAIWGDSTTAPFGSSSTYYAEIAASFVPAISTCSYTGGSGGAGVYVASGTANLDKYGVWGDISTSSWNYFSGNNGHSDVAVVMILDNGGGLNWLAAGVAIGSYSGGTQGVRSLFVEYHIGVLDYFTWVYGHSIPDNDGDAAKIFAYQKVSGNYQFAEYVYSSYWSTWWLFYATMGTTATGNLQANTVNFYTNSYNGWCNTVSHNSISNLMYSSSVSTNPTWSSWTGTCTSSHDSPYQVVTTGCPTSFVGSGV